LRRNKLQGRGRDQVLASACKSLKIAVVGLCYFGGVRVAQVFLFDV
jgi:hypothetical protein